MNLERNNLHMIQNNDLKLQIKTVDEKNRIISDMEEISRLVYLNDRESRLKLISIASLYRDLFPSVINDAMYNEESLTHNIKHITQYLETLLHTLSEIDIMTVTLPFIPSSNFVDSFYTIIDAKLGYSPTLKFVTDPSLVLGFTLDFKGHHMVRRIGDIINDYLFMKKDDILSGI